MGINDLIGYFDINRDLRQRMPTGKSASGQQIHWLPQWITVFAGVLVEPSFTHFRQTGVWTFDNFWGWALFALITTFIIFPSVYRRAFDETQPLAVLLPPIFTAGLGWPTILGAILKAGAKVTGVE